jgi:putative flavoprotein involved in K+ transport
MRRLDGNPARLADAHTQTAADELYGGNLAWSRAYSLYVALQIKARREGLATPVYRLAPAHHPG